jgi:hypothetical protein
MTLLFSTLAVLLMIFIPLGLAVWLRRRFEVPWVLFCLGILTFIGSQMVHIPLNNWLTDLGVIGEIGPDAPNLLRTAVILGLSAGTQRNNRPRAGLLVSLPAQAGGAF